MSRHGISRVRRRLAAALTLSLALVGTVLTGGADAAQAPDRTGATVNARTAGGTPQDGRIVFNDFGTGQVYTVNPDGTALVQVTHLDPGNFAFQAAWGPRSERIVFVSDKGGNNRLYLMRASGAYLRRLAPDRPGYQDFTPTFTPDGRRVVYTRCAPDPPGGCAIYSIRADGTGRHALTHYRTGFHQGADFFADVSPSGHRISFTRFDSDGVIAQVWLMRSDGSNAHPITPARMEAWKATWTPDGGHLLFADLAAHVGSSVYRMRPDGSRLRRLTKPRRPNNDTRPSASPRGSRIVFVSDRRHRDLCCRELYVMRADGRREHMIGTGLQVVTNPDWGSAPLLPAAAGTTAAKPTTSSTPAQARAAWAAERRTEPWLR